MKKKMKIYSLLVRKNNFAYYIHFLSIWAHLHQTFITEKTVEDYGTRRPGRNWQWVNEFIIYIKLGGK